MQCIPWRPSQRQGRVWALWILCLSCRQWKPCIAHSLKFCMHAHATRLCYMQPYLHASRHKHATRRVRGAGGRFLNSDAAKAYLDQHGAGSLDSAEAADDLVASLPDHAQLEQRQQPDQQQQPQQGQQQDDQHQAQSHQPHQHTIMPVLDSHTQLPAAPPLNSYPDRGHHDWSSFAVPPHLLLGNAASALATGGLASQHAANSQDAFHSLPIDAHVSIPSAQAGAAGMSPVADGAFAHPQAPSNMTLRATKAQGVPSSSVQPQYAVGVRVQ